MLPDFLKPMLASLGEPFDSSEYTYEIKWDGYRCIAFLDSYTKLQSRNLKDLTPIFPELVNLHQHSHQHGCIIDGEIITLRSGKPSFTDLQKRGQLRAENQIKIAAKTNPVLYVVFDILYHNDCSIINEPIENRREILLNNFSESNEFVFSKAIDGSGLNFFEASSKLGLEGVIAKKKASIYLPGKRVKYWQKFKKKCRGTFVICGFTLKPSSRGNLSALILGAYQQELLKLFGMVGTGFTQDELIILENELTKIKTQICPFTGTALVQKNTVWIKPVIVCEVEYLELTEDGNLRHPSFKKVRSDLVPEDCQFGEYR